MPTSSEPQGPLPFDDGDGAEHSRPSDHRADREIELPGDQEQGDHRRHDADFGGDVEVGRGRPVGEEAVGGQGEIEPDQDEADDGAESRAAGESPVERRAS